MVARVGGKPHSNESDITLKGKDIATLVLSRL